MYPSLSPVNATEFASSDRSADLASVIVKAYAE